MTREEHHTQDRVGLARDWRRSDVPGAVPEPGPAPVFRTHGCPYGCGFVTDYPPDMADHVALRHADEGREG